MGFYTSPFGRGQKQPLPADLQGWVSGARTLNEIRRKSTPRDPCTLQANVEGLLLSLQFVSDDDLVSHAVFLYGVDRPVFNGHDRFIKRPVEACYKLPGYIINDPPFQ